MQVLETNRRVQAQNNSPLDFPAFVRQGYDIKVLADGYRVDDKGLIFKVGAYECSHAKAARPLGTGMCRPRDVRLRACALL